MPNQQNPSVVQQQPQQHGSVLGDIFKLASLVPGVGQYAQLGQTIFGGGQQQAPAQAQAAQVSSPGQGQAPVQAPDPVQLEQTKQRFLTKLMTHIDENPQFLMGPEMQSWLGPAE